MRGLRPTCPLAFGSMARTSALVGAASVLAASATASTRAIVEDGWTSDFSIQSATRVPAGAVADVRALETVGSVDVLAYGPTAVAGPGGRGSEQSTLSVVGLPPRAFGRTIDLDVVDGSLGTLADGAVAVGHNIISFTTVGFQPMKGADLEKIARTGMTKVAQAAKN